MRFFLVLVFLLLAVPARAESSHMVYGTTTYVNETPLCAWVTIYDERADGWATVVSGAWVRPKSEQAILYKWEDHGVNKPIRYRAELYALPACKSPPGEPLVADLHVDVTTAGGEPAKHVRIILRGRFQIVSP